MKAVVLALLIAFFGVSYALFFNLTYSVSKCFKDDLPSNTLIIASVKSLDDLSEVKGNKEGVRTTIYDPKGKLLRDVVVNPEEVINIITQTYGMYRICLEGTRNIWTYFDSIRVSFKLDNEINQQEKNHLRTDDIDNKIITKTDQLLKRAQQIIQKQEYEKEKEREFSEAQSEFSSMFIWITCLQILVVLGTATWQIFNLRSFFNKKHIF